MDVIDGFLKVAGIKNAQRPMDDEACKLLSSYVTMIRALYLVHQENHWRAKSYGDHLLFERIYEKEQELADAAAERTIGLCGDILLEGAESVLAKKFAPQEDTLQSFIQSSLAAEKAYQEIAKKTYDELTEKDMMTLGLDDMIMEQASQSEVHIYLLQQAAKGYE